MSCPTDLHKFKEFIIFFTSFTRGGSVNIDDLTLLRKDSLYVSGLPDLNLAVRFSLMLEKLLNSSKIDCFLVISFSFTRIKVGKFDDFGNFPGSNVRSSSHAFHELLLFFSSSSA